MPRAKKTQSGDRAQKIESVAGQRYGEGVAQQQMQQAMPAPNRVATPPTNALPIQAIQPRSKPAMQDVAQMLAALPSNTMRRPTTNERPVTHGLPTGPGAGPEVLQPFMNAQPGLRTIEMLAKTSSNPLYQTILDRFRR